MKITFTTIFNRKNKLNAAGEAPIEIRAYEKRKRKFFSTKIFITPSQWNKRLNRINENHPYADALNSQISEQIGKLEKLQADHFHDNKPFTIDNVKKEIEKNINNGSFVDFVKTEIINNQVLAPKTKMSHNNTLNKLLEFKNNADFFFTEIDYSFVDDFLNFLRKQKLATNTVHKQHKNLKQYINLAIKKGYMLNNPCNDIKVKPDQKKREILTLDEIKRIETLDLSKFDENINTVRNLFLFACFTGLRISDATHLKPEYVKKEKEGFILDFITIKVNKRAEIPLYSLFKMPGTKKSKPEIILEKYYDKKKKYVFPVLSEPFINRHLKVIAELANIHIKVTFHTARHSFGTYMAGKIPLPQLMYLMQHSDIKTTMIYVNTNQEIVKQGLMKVDWNY